MSKRNGRPDLKARLRADPRNRSAKTAADLRYERIQFSEEQLAAARAKVAGDAEDAADALDLLAHLGLMPAQAGWYHIGPDPLMTRESKDDGDEEV